jgi:hypothetical protein
MKCTIRLHSTNNLKKFVTVNSNNHNKNERKSWLSGQHSRFVFLHCPITSSLLGPYIPLRTLFSNTLSLCSSLSVRDQVSHPYTHKGICEISNGTYTHTDKTHFNGTYTQIPIKCQWYTYTDRYELSTVRPTYNI